MKVNRENMRKWVDALRSGEYEQGQDTLHNAGHEFCCLGVACDVSGIDGRWEKVQEGSLIFYSYLGELDYLPTPVMEWLGLNESNPTLILEDGTKELAGHANDWHRLTFEQIADAIERTYLS